MKQEIRDVIDRVERRIMNACAPEKVNSLTSRVEAQKLHIQALEKRSAKMEYVFKALGLAGVKVFKGDELKIGGSDTLFITDTIPESPIAKAFEDMKALKENKESLKKKK